MDEAIRWVKDITSRANVEHKTAMVLVYRIGITDGVFSGTDKI